MGKELNLSVISRRHFKMGGTRFNSRGVDDDGNCANFVETEMIVEYPSMSLMFSHV